MDTPSLVEKGGNIKEEGEAEGCVHPGNVPCLMLNGNLYRFSFYYVFYPISFFCIYTHDICYFVNMVYTMISFKKS